MITIIKTMSSTINTNNINNINTSEIVFKTPVVQTIYNTKIQYKRVNITKSDLSDLIICTDTLFSFGIQESTLSNTKNCPICLTDRDGATPDQLQFIEKFNEIIEHIKSYLLDNRIELCLPDLERSDLKKLNPIYTKDDKSSIYVKMLPFTKIYDSDNKLMQASELENQFFRGAFAIKLESIFIGSKISVQLKLLEISVDEIIQAQVSRPRLL